MKKITLGGRPPESYTCPFCGVAIAESDFQLLSNFVGARGIERINRVMGLVAAGRGNQASYIELMSGVQDFQFLVNDPENPEGVVQAHLYQVLCRDQARCGRTSFYIRPLSSNGTPGALYMIYPRTLAGRPCPADVPDDVRDLYDEARKLLDDSPRASAALSRAALELVLKHLRYSEKGLHDMIEAARRDTDNRTYLRERLHEVRVVGNQTLHVEKMANPGQVFQVDPGEAELVLGVVWDLLEERFAQPARAAREKTHLLARYPKLGKVPPPPPPPPPTIQTPPPPSTKSG